jgi:hypothetical protein
MVVLLLTLDFIEAVLLSGCNMHVGLHLAEDIFPLLHE